MVQFVQTKEGRDVSVHMTRVMLAECVVRDGERLDKQVSGLLTEWAQWCAAKPPDEAGARAWAQWTTQGETLVKRSLPLTKKVRTYRVRATAVLARAYRAELIGPVPNDDETARLADEWVKEVGVAI